MLRRTLTLALLMLCLLLPLHAPAAHAGPLDAEDGTRMSSPWNVWAWFLDLLGIPASEAAPASPSLKSDDDPGSFIDPDGFAAAPDPWWESGQLTSESGQDGGSMQDPNG